MGKAAQNMPLQASTMPPAIAVDSIAEVLAIADAMERAAAAQYSKFGQWMRQVGHVDVAAVFEALAVEEQHHIESVRHLAESMPGAATAVDPHRLTLPETLSAEEIGPPALLTPYKALSIAVRTEEKAFKFWSYVASNAANEPVRRQAEAMARQELVHAAKLRHERRRAYHAEPGPHRRREAIAEAAVDQRALQVTAAQLAAGSVHFLLVAAERLEAMADKESAELLVEVASHLQQGQPRPPAEPANNDRVSTLRRIEQSAVAGRAGILFDAAGCVEQVLELYLQMLEVSADSRMTESLQVIGDRAAHDVARLNARLYAIEPSLAGIANNGGAKDASTPARH